MSRLGRVLRGENRYALGNPPEAFYGVWSGPTAASGARISDATVLGHADAYACIRVIADAVSMLPLITYRRTPGGRERVKPGSIPVDALLRKPNPFQTQGGFFATMVTHLNVYGNAYIVKRRSRGPVNWLGFVDPKRVAVGMEAGEPVYTIQKGSDDLDGKYGPRDILHIKALSIDGIVGMSPITQAREALGLGMTLQEYAGSHFANGSTPAGVLSVQGTLSSEAAERLKDQWEARRRGSRNAGGTAVLEAGTTFQSISSTMLDAQFLEQRKLSATEMARIFRVPPWMIGAEAGSSMTYSNTEQQQLVLATHTLQPWLVCIEDHLKADEDFYPPDEANYPEFLIDALLRADSMNRANVYALATAGKPWMTRNEVRQRENLPLVKGGDELDPPQPSPGGAAQALTAGASNG